MPRAARRRARRGVEPGRRSQPEPGRTAPGRPPRAAVGEIFDVAERLASGSAGPQGPDVAWVSRFRRAGRRGRGRLHIAPLSVAGLLRDTALRRPDGGADLGHARRSAAPSRPPPASVGLLGEDAPAWRGLDVGSPFDYPRQGILYVARHLPPPGRDGISPAALDELAALVEAAGGRTLGLFSSTPGGRVRRRVELRERLDVPVLCQGEDPTPTLVREFAADAPTCLFGTLSLWQGVDVPGPACQLVVIDRIPFPRPDDPLSVGPRSRPSRAAAGTAS